MEKIDQIINHPLFRLSMEKIEGLEEERHFCRHGMSHCLAVARIAYISVLEQGLGYSKETIYGAALLHDIGRWQQYTARIPHHLASEELAEIILADTDYTDAEKRQILDGIRRHRSREEAYDDTFAKLLYEADKSSRACWLCKVSGECYWPEEQKNKGISI